MADRSTQVSFVQRFVLLYLSQLFFSQRVVLDYLTVHGYSATAESFAKSTGQHLQEQVSSIRNRQSLFNAILE